MNRFTLSVMGVLLSTLFTQAYANEALDEEENTVVITATKTKKLVNNTLSDVSVITQEDIQNSGASSLDSLLKRTTGVDVISSGGKGSSPNISIRGTSSSQSIVLVDGVRQAQASNGGTNLQFIPLDQIDRIEIVKGSASSLYGADAMGGVIQIFTKKPTDGHHQTVGIGFGSYNYSNVNAGATGKIGTVGYQLNTSYENTTGFSRTNKDSYSYNPDKDGYRNTTFSGKLDYEWLTGQNVKVSFYQGKGSTEFDQSSVAQDDNDFKLRQFAVESENTLIANRLYSILKYSEFEDKSNISAPEATPPFDYPKSHINTKTKNASWLLRATPVDKLNIILGLDWKKDNVNAGPKKYIVSSRDNKAAFLGLDWELHNHLIEGSMRYDDNEQFGDKVTGRLGYGYKITPNLTAKASYATGFRAPTFNDLYFPTGGNPDLKPEESKNSELGLNYRHNRFNIGWVVFQNKIKNNIIWAPPAGGGAIWRPENVEKAKITGTSLSGNVYLSEMVTLNFGATYQDPKNKTTGKTLERRAKFIGTAGLDFTPDEKWLLNVNVYARGKTYDDKANKYRLDGYTTVNIGAHYQITPTLRTSLTAENLFNKEYTEAKGYNTPKQSVFWRLIYQN